MYNVSTAFHTASIKDNVSTRVRFVFADTAQTVLGSERINLNTGVSVTETFCKGEDMSIGGCRSALLNVAFMNYDGALNDFEYGKCTVYLDLKINGAWEACPLGVFIIDKPKKRRNSIVSVQAYDQMVLLEAIADAWWDELTFPMTLGEIFASMCTVVGVESAANADALNLNVSYEDRPFQASEITYREILGWISEAAGCTARFTRTGKLELAWFTDISADVPASRPAFTADISEYTVSQIDKVQVSATQTDVGVIIGSGTNGYQIMGNPFLSGASEEETLLRSQPVASRLFAFAEYIPITTRCMCDWSIQAGDIITITLFGNTYEFPVFKQKIQWSGKSARVNYENTGNETRGVMSAENRKSFATDKAIHELEVTAELLRSAIKDTDGRQTQILQTAEEMITTALQEYVKESDVGGMISEVVSSEIKQTADELTILFNTQISDLEGETKDQFNEISTYIRFNASGVVIGKTDSEIKLKLENEILYFFTGDEETVNTENALAYFSSGKLYVTKSQIQQLTIGTTGRLMDFYILGSGENTAVGMIGRLS